MERVLEVQHALAATGVPVARFDCRERRKACDELRMHGSRHSIVALERALHRGLTRSQGAGGDVRTRGLVEWVCMPVAISLALPRISLNLACVAVKEFEIMLEVSWRSAVRNPSMLCWNDCSNHALKVSLWGWSNV